MSSADLTLGIDPVSLQCLGISACNPRLAVSAVALRQIRQIYKVLCASERTPDRTSEDNPKVILGINFNLSGSR
jgi:hypothetical protein